MRWVGLTAAAAFVATIWLANWLLATYGIVPVGFGLAAPAGVFAAGLAFTLRDLVHQFLGRVAVIGCILAGAALAYLVAPAFAVASAVAFLVSEMADMAVYTPLARTRPALAVALSNTVGAIIDSALFLWLAFGSLEFLTGQVVGKSWVTLASLPLFLGVRFAVSPPSERTNG